MIAAVKRSSQRFHYLLATCGNDSLVKLWYISAFPAEEDFTADCVLWRQLTGHGGNVMCVRFTPVTGEILASTATDKTIRLWNVASVIYC
jgi:WD40 repeat protein